MWIIIGLVDVHDVTIIGVPIEGLRFSKLLLTKIKSTYIREKQREKERERILKIKLLCRLSDEILKYLSESDDSRHKSFPH